MAAEESVVDDELDCLFEVEFFQNICGFNLVHSELLHQKVHFLVIYLPLSKI